MEEIANALELKNELDSLRPIDKEKEAIIMQKFRLDWNYHSNHLEGNSLTYGETKALILFGITAQGKPLKDTLEITGHNEAINWVIDLVKGERPLTENFIRELHSLLLKDSYKESKNADGIIVPRKISAGKYKTTTNHVETVTGEIFYFASPEETPAKMHDLLNWYNEKTKEETVNPILIAAEFHYLFIRIHPFDDGNGRTARILMNFILMQFGFPPVIIKTEDKANYFAALQMADAGNVEAFVNYIAQNLVSSLEIMISGAKGENIEEDDDLDKEIALLEQKLYNTYQKVEYSNELLSQSIFKLIEKFIQSISKFSKLYQSYHQSLRIDETIIEIDEKIFVEKLKTLFEEDEIPDFIELDLSFFGLKQEKNKSINFINMFMISFDSDSFQILTYNNELVIEMQYGTQFSDEEINKIIKIEVKRHKEYIESIIDEKEYN